MKYKLLAIQTPDTVNIGDYIQALASRQFLPHVDGFIERDLLKDYDGDACRMIMNGWYMHNPKQWPPADKIDPLFVSVHVNKLAEEVMLQGEGVEYFKNHEPIGCRDYYTVNILKNKGIESYFSGCMTLTLGQTYKYYGGKREGVYFVDADVFRLSRKEYPFLLCKSIVHLKLIRQLYSRNWRYTTPLAHWCRMTKFYELYSPLFGVDTLRSATYISQQSPYFKEKYHSNEELLQCAEQLVKQYAKAQMVVTSRIHCALPCTGLGTPVIFVDNEDLGQVHRCRFDGLLQLFNVLRMKENRFDTSVFDIDHSKKISPTNMPPLKENWKPLANALIKKCKDWVMSI